MKRIGIVANHKTVNYGTMLQAYAMQKAIEALGFEAETIDLSGLERDIRRKKLEYFNSQMSKAALLDSKLPYLKKRLKKMINRKFRVQSAIREQKFREFRCTHFPMSEPCLNRLNLTQFAKKYDSVLVGSDQIWLPSNIAADIFTLSFVPDSINKVAYASSFGVSSLQKTQWNAARAFLQRINHVSVRERSGQRIVQEVASRNIPVVCDPTLLFTKEQWDKMILPLPVIKEPYILCYFLGNNPDQRAFVSNVRKITGLKIVSLLHMDEYIKSDNRFPDIAPFNIGPNEFLNLIRFASFVFTDSFHGTALSILNQRSVFTFDRFKQNASLSTNTRIDSLYEITGLQERHINAMFSPTSCVNMAVDYEKALMNISDLREASWNYLRQSLEEA